MDVAEKLAEVQRLKAEIDAQGELPEEVLRKINYKFRLDWNYYSNSMEGGTLTKQETHSIMVGNITIGGKPMKDVLEMSGHDEVVNSILKIGKGELAISEKRIREIHKAIMHEEDEEKKKQVGEWKTHPNEIINYKNEKFDFTPPSEVKEKMHELINWLGAEADKLKYAKKDAPDPVLLAFEFHLRYLTIHPFYDGNGRTARILMNLILISYGYPPVIINDKQKQTYYQYLADVQVYEAPKDLYYDFMAGLLIHSLQLVEKAVSGGDLEEADDFDKHLALFKTKFGKNKKAIPKSKEVIIEIYLKSLKPLFEKADKKLHELDEFFNISKAIYWANNTTSSTSGNDTIDYIDKRILYKQSNLTLQDLTEGSKIPEKISLADTGENIKMLMLQFNWTDFNRAGTFTFNYGVSIRVEFEDLKYKISTSANPPQEKILLYDEYLEENEIGELVNKLAKDTLRHIELKAESPS